MAKKMNAYDFSKGGESVSRPGVHAKTRHSNNKKSKHYKKKYRGQGR